MTFYQALCLIDKGPFRRLLMYLRPSLSERDIPHRTTLRKEILKRAELVEARLKSTLKVSSHVITCTFVHIL